MPFRSYIFIIITILCSVTQLWGAGFSANLNASKVVVNDAIMLEVSAKSGMPEITEFPQVPNLRLLSKKPQRTGVNSYNFDTTYSGTFLFIPSKIGKYTIPPITIKAGDKKFTTPALSFEVVSQAKHKVDASGITLAEATFGKINVLSDRKEFFIGEYIPVSIDIYTMQGIRAELRTYPVLDIPKAVFRDYSSVNRQSSKFAMPKNPRLDIVDGRNYQKMEFLTAFRSLAPDKMKLDATYQIAIAQQQQRSQRRSMFDDDFFDSFMDRTPMKIYTVKCLASPEISIIPLPPAPENTQFIGAIGSGNLEFALDAPNTIKVGELINLQLKLKGNYGQETFDIPKLTLDAMRVYPPEVKQVTPELCTVNYAIIPLRPGTNHINVNFATFNPIAKKYETYSFAKEFAVTPAERALSSISTEAPKKAEPMAEEVAPLVTNHEIFYLKTNLDRRCQLSVIWVWLLFLAGPALLVMITWYRKVAQKRNSSDSYQRLAMAKRGKALVIKHLENATDEANFASIINSEVVPLLNDALNLPPGSTGSDISQLVEDSELKIALESSSQSSFMPLGNKMLTMEQQSGVIKALKRLLTVFIFICGISLSANSLDEGIKFYDHGDFVKAAQVFEKLPSDNVTTLYNRGLCYYMMQDYAQSLLDLERAHRLAPRDTTVMELLNLVRQKLNRPMLGEVNSPLDLIYFVRNTLRPSEWLLIAAISWFLIFVILIFKAKLGRNLTVSSCSILAVIVIVALIFQITLNQHYYNRNLAIIVGNGATLRSLPSDLGREEGIIPAGNEVTILEQRSAYTLIKIGNIEGWTNNKNVASIL